MSARANPAYCTLLSPLFQPEKIIRSPDPENSFLKKTRFLLFAAPLFPKLPGKKKYSGKSPKNAGI